MGGTGSEPTTKRVGFFDSGIGGIAVARAFLRLRPQADVVYIADWENCPYGDKPDAEICARALTLADQLVEKHLCRMLVVACNSASAVALEEIRARHPLIPVVGMEPAVKPAAALSKTGAVGVLATAHTLAGDLLRETTKRWAGSVQVVLSEGKGFVELAETGDLDSPQAFATVAAALKPLLERGCDPVVLGCTHYPLLMPLLEKCAPGVTFLDPCAAVAKRAACLYDALG